jgi:hypothetical protein
MIAYAADWANTDRGAEHRTLAPACVAGAPAEISDAAEGIGLIRQRLKFALQGDARALAGLSLLLGGDVRIVLAAPEGPAEAVAHWTGALENLTLHLMLAQGDPMPARPETAPFALSESEAEFLDSLRLVMSGCP